MQAMQVDVEAKDLKKVTSEVVGRLYYCFKGQVADLEAELEAQKTSVEPSSKKPKVETTKVSASMVQELCKEAMQAKAEAGAAVASGDTASLKRLERLDAVLERLDYISEKLKYLEARAMEDRYDPLEVKRVLRGVAEERMAMKAASVLEDELAAEFVDFLDKDALKVAKTVWYEQYLEQRRLSAAIAEANSVRQELHILWKSYMGLCSMQRMPWEDCLEITGHEVVTLLEKWEPLQKTASELTVEVLHKPGEPLKAEYAEAVATIWRECFLFPQEKLAEFPAAEISDFWGTWSSLRDYWQWSEASFKKGKQWGLK